MSASLLEFAHVNDAVAATASKLQKQALLAAYFANLDADDLRLAVRFAGGGAFPETDERVIGVSGAILGEAILSTLRIDPNVFWQATVDHGDMGDALAATFQPTSLQSSIALKVVAEAFDRLAETTRAQEKREILKPLIARLSAPREGAYLVKIILGDLRTGVQAGVLQAAVARAFDKPLPQVQRCQLLVGNLEEVALLARHNRMCDATFRLFHPLQFMLAQPEESPDSAMNTINGRGFLVEDKLDGIRAQVHKQADRLAIYSRTMDRIDESFPEVVQGLLQVPGDFLLDGEIVAWRNGVALPFAHIQKRLGRKSIPASTLRDNPCAFIAFDCLYRDGELLLDSPLHQRKEALQSVAQSAPANSLLHGVNHREVRSIDDIRQAFEEARGRQNEGLILKDPASAYAPGRRGQNWLKLKTHLPTIDCVVTAAEYGHGKRRGTLSDYTFAVWDRAPSEEGAKLVNIGKAYSGVTDEEILQLTEIFLKISTGNNGYRFAVPPQVVLEIAADQIHRSKRHASGFALRFPRIKRIRWDKRPEDADLLDRVKAIFASDVNFAPQGPDPAPEPTLFDP